MILEQLELNCFRNYSHLCFKPQPRTLITGRNGQGKTNLLEALVLLTQGQSFRPHLPSSLVQEGETQARIRAHISKEDGKSQLELLLDHEGKKQFFINKKKTSRSSIQEELPIILFTPESFVLLKGGAEHRRNWLDNWLINRGCGTPVKEFRRALKQKNQLLKQGKYEEISSKKQTPLLEALNQVFIKKNLNLIQARREALEKLKPHLEVSSSLVFKNISMGKATCKVEPRLLVRGAEEQGGFPENPEEFFKKQLQKNLAREQAAGLSLYGGHRDDFQLLFQGRDTRFFCSQGQSRALLLSLKMAQILELNSSKNSAACLLLLDDVFSEIDSQLLLNLLDFLNEIPSQIILTSVQAPSFLDRAKFQIFDLSEGILRKDFLGERRNKTTAKPSFY